MTRPKRIGMKQLIIDASVTLAWLFAENETTGSIEARLAEASLVAPSLWRLEVVNAILVNERRQQITPSQGTRFLHIVEALEIDVVSDQDNRGMVQLALLARPHQLSAYDAAYLELATTMGLPLWTYDGNLQSAAQRMGIEWIGADG